MKEKALGTSYKDGEIVIKKGSVGNCLYVIQYGKVEILDEKDGVEIKIAELSESDFFGEMGIFEKDVRSCTVRALGDAKILTVDKRNLLKTIQQDATLAYRMLEKLSNRLRKTNIKLTESLMI